MSPNRIVISEAVRAKHICPAGTHNAVCAGVYELGVQRSTNGWPDRPKLAMVFEVGEKIPEGPLAGHPYRVSKIVSATLSDKSTLTTLLTSWLGRDPRQRVNGRTEFEPSSLIGKPCMLTVAHKTGPDGESQAIITAISSHMKGLPALTSMLDPNETPDWIRRMENQRLDKPQQDDASQPTPEAAAENPPSITEEDVGAGETS